MPKISVIIPCYNAEKFIRQCLVSVLSSKFTDYEVIVIDDCSTDKTISEVEKFSSSFDGRLKILSTQKNSGGAGIPRNLGIKSATGKYITFVDNDDMILPTALGNFFEVAEEFNADVVHTEKHFAFYDFGNGNFEKKDLLLQSDEPLDSLTNEIISETNDLNERINKYVEGKFFWLPWGKFYRRSFLLNNEIKFPQIKFSEDMFFCFKCMCLAENYVRVPFVTNIHRIRHDSTSKKYVESSEGVQEWLGVILPLIEKVDDFMNTNDFFTNNPAYHQSVLKFFIDMHFKFIQSLFNGVQVHEIQRIFFDKLDKQNYQQSKNILLAYLCTKFFGK
ncbi:MAG: glycosyltransferase family 2 protein [Selenomonadaceae bacterium]|nr:glycosyltransferase family 2 protein [Selenomonadaceae bacterium]